ncbi:hypothetical protein CPB84DRAFT_1767202 [Gymnopilus junonius]|uniref:Uncharacterized protein n=1 Tax=Gymnopilus junonius TaxID=109634 RepID=A0A9P5NVG1_GYMJU|nr:hypothetical protein CPB84DRAFT_1767202 [Gymnopilus junonius]
MMEAKLRQMESSNPRPKPSRPTSAGDMQTTNDSYIPVASTLPYHPSLPSKPPPSLPSHLAQAPSRPSTPTTVKPKTSLPALPLLPQPLQGQHLGPVSETKHLGAKPLQKSISVPTPSNVVQPRPAKSSKLIGVKIKPKQKTQME